LTTLIPILAATVIISLIAFVGIFTLLVGEELLDRSLLVLVALSTGNFIYIGVVDLIPEIKHQVSLRNHYSTSVSS
jgi:zinc transporter ZupT